MYIYIYYIIFNDTIIFWSKPEVALSSTNYTPFLKRYIDDIFGIWRHSEDQLHTFIQHLNSINPNIKVSICSRLIFWIATSLKITPNFQQKFFSNQQTHTNFYIINLIIPHMSSKALLKRNYFATFVYHHIFMISCNPTAFLNLIF